MALKAITETQVIINNVAVSGTVQVIGSVSNIKYKDSISIQYNCTGNATGSFAIQGSLDYNPGTTQAQAFAGGYNAGNWNSITLSPTPSISSGSGTYLVNMNQLAFPYIRSVFTNSSGTGILSGFIFCKSLG